MAPDYTAMTGPEMLEGMGELMDDDDSLPRIIVCAGPPACLLVDDEAIAAAQAGCVWCRRITLHPDGRETETGPGHA